MWPLRMSNFWLRWTGVLCGASVIVSAARVQSCRRARVASSRSGVKVEVICLPSRRGRLADPAMMACHDFLAADEPAVSGGTVDPRLGAVLSWSQSYSLPEAGSQVDVFKF